MPQARRVADLVASAEGVAESIPEEPHGRDRSLMQALCVREWIRLGDLARAEASARRIGDWRRGEATALVGQALAARGERDRARSLASEARELGAREEDWRRDRVGAEVARLLLMLGEDGSLDGLVDPTSAVESARVAAAVVDTCKPDRLSSCADAFERAVASGAFDSVRGALDGYLAVLRRPECDDALVARATKCFDGAMEGLPHDVRVIYLSALAEALGARGRLDDARARLARADAVLASTAFLPEDQVPVSTPAIAARTAIGDRDAARASLRALRAAFEGLRTQVVDVRRAMSWRALAEAYAALGERGDATACFAAALDDGALNPNARPRAEDLCQTMLAMSRTGAEPTPAMDSRIRAIRAGLVDPW